MYFTSAPSCPVKTSYLQTCWTFVTNCDGRDLVCKTGGKFTAVRDAQVIRGGGVYKAADGRSFVLLKCLFLRLRGVLLAAEGLSPFSFATRQFQQIDILVSPRCFLSPRDSTEAQCRFGGRCRSEQQVRLCLLS